MIPRKNRNEELDEKFNSERKTEVEGELVSRDLPVDMLEKMRTFSISKVREIRAEDGIKDLPAELLDKTRTFSACKAAEKEGEEVTKDLPQDLLERMKTMNTGKATELEGEAAKRELPIELQEAIISMMPFPHIFKARALSRSWLARFSPISSLDDEASRNLATCFQRLVNESSQKWKTFCPVWFGRTQLRSSNTFKHEQSDIFSFGYDRASQKWRKLPSLSFLPRYLEICWKHLQIEGALLYGLAWLGEERHHFVANILTRSYKILPPCPTVHPDGVKVASLVWTKLMSNHRLLGYQIILVRKYYEYNDDNKYYHCAQIYDSNSDDWITKKIISLSKDGIRTVAFVNGILYMGVSYNPQRPTRLFAFSVEEGTVEVLNMSLMPAVNYYADSNLVDCNTSLMWIPNESEAPTTVQVFKVDLKSPQLIQVAKRARAFPYDWRAPIRSFSAGNCIFIREETHDYFHPNLTCHPRCHHRKPSFSHRVLTYDVDEDKWGCFDIPEVPNNMFNRDDDWGTELSTSRFQPGLNPFMAV